MAVLSVDDESTLANAPDAVASLKRHVRGHRNMKALGRKPEGARLERIKASPLWAGERFRNVHPVITGLRDPNVPMPTLGDFLCGGDRRTPRGPLPSMNPLEAWAR